MALTDKEAPSAIEDKKDKNKNNVAEYLQAPRKKRKRYVVIATGPQIAPELSLGIEQYVRANFKTMAIAQPKTADEFQKNFGRQIMLLVYDDEFLPLEQGLDMLAELKRRRNQAPIPVLFLTRNPAALIEAYHRSLAPFHEADDYVNHVRVERAEIYSRIRHGLNNKNARRSRRYKVDIHLEYFLLADDQMHQGRLIDLSVHGSLLKADDGRIFRPGDQLKLHLPIAALLSSSEGDYLKISARVRRIYIIGDQAGISFEYLSEQKLLTLTAFLTALVTEQATKRAAMLRMKGGRAG